jgi:PAS domain-containing protein
MGQKPTCEELAKRVEELEKKALISSRARDALQESEERYRMIFNHSPLGIIHFDQ